MSELDPPAVGDSPGESGRHESDVVTKISSRSVPETVSSFTALLISKGLKIFAVIDQSGEARLAGLQLRDTVLVVFGSPAAGTPVMEAAPLSALDLPLKVLIWSDEGETNVSYLAPDALAARHALSPELAANLRGIDALDGHAGRRIAAPGQGRRRQWRRQRHVPPRLGRRYAPAAGGCRTPISLPSASVTFATSIPAPTSVGFCTKVAPAFWRASSVAEMSSTS